MNWKLAASAAGLLLLWATLGWATGRWSIAAVTCLFAVTVWLAASELALRVRLRRLEEEGRQLAGTAVPHSAIPLPARLAGLSALRGQIEARLAQEESVLRETAQRRAQAEEELRQSKERYLLAVSGANDGMWEWNHKTRKAYFSPRAKSMLGYAEDEIGNDIQEWRSRIHPDDLQRALLELRAHLDGRTSRFEFEHRMRHKDGTWRWILARAAVVRHANGKPERLIGLYTDISARKQLQQVLLELADGLSGLSSEDAYAALVQKFATIVGAREAFLTECCSYPATRVRMLAYWYRGQFAPCEEFDLEGTPCEEVILKGHSLFVPRGATERWAQERQWGTEAYLGLPCVDTKGTVIGHIACKNGTELTRDLPHDAILKLFAVRASVEMERQFLERLRASMPEGEVAHPAATIH
jgi:PAS domain S-box-containing protein